MIYVNSIMNAIYTLLSSDSTLGNSNVTIELNEPYNLDINRTPWVGVYNNDIEIAPHRCNYQAPWLAVYRPLIYVQEQQYITEERSTSDALDKLLTPVMSVVNSNRTLLGTVDMTRGYEITPYQLDIEQEDYIWAYQIMITAEKRQ